MGPQIAMTNGGLWRTKRLQVEYSLAGEGTYNFVALIIQDNNITARFAALKRFPEAGVYLTSGQLTGELIPLGRRRFGLWGPS